MVRIKNRYVLGELILDNGQSATEAKLNTKVTQQAIQAAVHQIHGDFGTGAVTAGFTGPRCIKLTINGNSVINGNYHGSIVQEPIKFKVSIEVAIDSKVTIDVKYVGPQTNTVLIKVRHRAVKFLTSSLPFVKIISNIPCCFQTLHVAGTIRACQKFLVKHNRRQLTILFSQSKTQAEKNAVLDSIKRCGAKETKWTDWTDPKEQSDSENEDNSDIDS